MNVEQKNRLIALCDNMKSYGYTDGVEELESIFPQLRESEDERIRKAIESIIHVYGKTQGEWIAGYDMDTLVVHLRNAFASLEKQKALSELGKYIATERTKPGFMFAGNDSVSWEELPLDVRKHDYPYYFIGDLDCYPFNVEKQKEQKPGEDSEYRKAYLDGWNARNLQAAREQKPVEWSEHQHKLLNYAISMTEDVEVKSFLESLRNTSSKVKWSEEDDVAHTRILGAVAKAFIGVLPTKPSKEDVDWFKSLPERFNLQLKQEWSEDIILKAVKEVGLTQHQIDWFKINVFPPKSKWSEEDEKIYKTIYSHFTSYNQYACSNGVTKEDVVRFLESLRLQPKPEWNKKDKKIVRALQHALNCADAQNTIAKSGVEVSEVATFLQDLVPSWKPSEEQLEAARYVSQFDYGGHKAALVSLYEQLKAL